MYDEDISEDDEALLKQWLGDMEMKKAERQGESLEIIFETFCH